MDVFGKTRRSDVMSRIRSSHTGIEMVLSTLVRAAVGPRWRIITNAVELPGRPDIVVPGLRLVVFADGCFFHSCPRHGRVPDSNLPYWQPKLERTVRRDRKNRRALRELGYAVWRVWEHDLEGRAIERTRNLLERRVEAMLRDRKSGQMPRSGDWT